MDRVVLTYKISVIATVTSTTLDLVATELAVGGVTLPISRSDPKLILPLF